MKSIAFDSLEQAVTAFGMVMRSFVKPFGLKMGKRYRGQTWYYDCVTTSHKKQDRESKVETRRVVGKHKSINMNKGLYSHELMIFQNIYKSVLQFFQG